MKRSSAMQIACWLWVIAASFPATAEVHATATTVDSSRTFEATAMNAAAAALNALYLCRDTGAVCEITEVDGYSIRRAVDLKPDATTPLPLWRFDSDTATVFVGGSMHLLKESLLPLPRPFLDAFDESEVLAIEVNPTAVEAEHYPELVRRFLLLDDGRTLMDVLPGGTWHRLESRLTDFDIRIAQVQHLKPGFLAVEVGRLRYQELGYLPHLGVEQHFLQRIGDRAIHEIESIEAQFELIASQPPAVQLTMLEQAVAPLDVIESEVASLVSAWLSGDLDALVEAMRDDGQGVPGFDDFMRRMIDDRNVIMADAAARYLDGAGTVFVLVGAGHLGGPMGVIQQLQTTGRSKGWTSRRFASDGSMLP